MTAQSSPAQWPVHAHGQFFTTRCRALQRKGRACLSTGSTRGAAHALWKKAAPARIRRAWHGATGGRDAAQAGMEPPGQTNLTRDAEDTGIASLTMASPGWTNFHHTLRSLGTQGLRTLIHKFSVQCRTPVVEKRFRPAFATHGLALPAHGDHAGQAGQIFTTRCEALGHKGCAPLSTSSPCSAAHRLWKSASGLHSPMHDPALPAYEGCMEGMRSPPRLPRPGADYCRRTACTTCNRRRRRITSARWLRSRTWMLKHSTAALKSRSR